MSAHPSLVPFQNFPTADGWIVLGCAKEKFWLRTAAAIGLPELAEDARFASFAARGEHAAELLPRLAERFRSKPTAFWLSQLTAAGVPCGPVNNVAEALSDPQTIARGLVTSVGHPELGELQLVRTAMRIGDEPGPAARAPSLSADEIPILAELLGYDDQRVAALRAAGAFGADDVVSAGPAAD